MTRGAYKPRTYQLRSVDEVRAACRRREMPILVLPTGGGKTKTAVHGIVAPSVANGSRVLWLAHRSELIDQAVDDIADAGIIPGVIMGGRVSLPAQKVQVASIQTLARRLDRLPPADVVILDECHHVRSATYMKVIAHYQETGALIIGLTATPRRLDGNGLGKVFDHIVEEVTTAELIESGHLAEFRYYAPAIPDTAGVRTVGGDFNRRGIAEVMNRPELVGDLVTHYRERMDGKRALVFATGIAHSQAIVEKFKAAGYPAEHLDGGTPRDERADELERFRTGETLVLSNVDLFSEGFDVPSCQGVIIARPTQSFVMHRQMIGRCLRPKTDGSSAVINDHAGNFLKHGLPDDEAEWDLAGKDRKLTTSKHKQCPQCFAVCAVSASECLECGHVFSRTSRIPIGHVDGDLEEVTSVRKVTQADKKSYFEAVLAQARWQGYAPGWASHKFKKKFGSWPKGFVTELRKKSFEECDHARLDGVLCNHCGKEINDE